ncbi:MAG: hydroxyacid dehydrogenase [Parcubacteria group bacterium]|nr:hydroxyacid dehydrogenase [Parcubacteria group bacterium]
MKYKILNTIGEAYTQEARDILSRVGEVEYKPLTQKDLVNNIDNYDIVVIGLGLNFNKDILKKADKLKIIATATTGLDHIDLDAARERGIEILSLRGETEFLNTITGTAELAMGLLIDLVRFTPWAFDNVKEYKWEREKFRGHNLYGKTLGIVGMGRLGTWMARYGKAFGMNIIYYDPHAKLPTSDVSSLGQGVSFDELLEKSDIISLHAHLNKETENMFNAEVFKKMKNTAYLINTARGGIVDEKALLNALKNKEIAGYGTDVLADELSFNNGFTNHPLIEYAKQNRNVIIVPHIGGMTVESRERTDIFIAEKLKKHLTINN